MQKRWQIRKVEKNCLKQLCCDLSLPVPIARTLMNRGIFTPREAERFLDPGLSLLEALGRLPFLNNAALLLDQAIRDGSRILIFGDYDADGLTACAILTLFIRKFTDSVEPYIPNRFSEGYGLSERAMPTILEKKPHLVITVDCGIKDFEGVCSLKRQGITVIVTDHHLPEPGRWPEADVVLATHERETGQLVSPLSGAGVALALVQACADLRTTDREPINEYLDLACVGTVGDVVPLVGLNRAIVKHGLKKINQDPHPGIQAMIELTGLQNRQISAGEIGFIIAPRLNAAGRMNDSAPALRLLLSRTYEEAYQNALCLNELNEQRRREVDRMLRQIDKSSDYDIYQNDEFVVLSGKDWNLGVLGIIASRLSDRLDRPVMMLGENGGMATGSARSIVGFNLSQALDAVSGLINQYGGHAMAAGLKVEEKNIPRLRAALNEQYGHEILSLRGVRKLIVDAQITLGDVNSRMLSWLEKLEPFGEKNPNPLFAVLNVSLVKSWTWGKKNQHLKVLAQQGREFQEAVVIYGANTAGELGQSSLVDLAIEVYRNNYGNYPYLKVHDWRIKK